MRGAILRLSGVCLLLCLLATIPVIAQETFGGLSGKASDQTGAVIPGATVTATNKATNRATSSTTSGDGTYVMRVDPGRYSVKVEKSGFQPVEFPDISVILGSTLKLDVQLKVGAVTTSLEVTEVVPLIDTQSTLVAHNLTQEEFDRIPKPRSFQGVAITSPGVNQGEIEGGIQVNGASGAENSFVIDGVVTNSLVEGQSRQNTVFEYLQEIQVKTAGIGAEYGGALGGVISAVTRSGGNDFHGEAHYYYLGSGLSAGPIPRIQLSPVDNQTVFHLQDQKQDNHQHEFGGSLGGPVIHDKLFFFTSLSPRLVRRTNNYLFSNGTDPGSLHKEQTVWQGFGKLGFTSNRVRANASLLATPTRDMGALLAYNGLGTNFRVASKDAAKFQPTQGFAIDQYNWSGNLDFTVTHSSILSLRGGYFSDRYQDIGIPRTPGWIYNRTSVGYTAIPANLQGPIGTQNLPQTQIGNDLTKRYHGQADYSFIFNAAGSHVFQGGFGAERFSNDVNNEYPGGRVYIYWNSSKANFNNTATDRGLYGYYRVDDLATRGRVGANILSMYVKDSWTIGKRLTLNLGLRTEQEKVPTFRSDIRKYAFQFGFGDKLAPRLGAAYDVTGNGKVKVYGSWSRLFDWTKYEIVRGSFGGDLWHIHWHALDTTDIGSLNLGNLPGKDLWGSPTGFQDLRGTNIEATDPNLKPMFQDATNIGVEYQLSRTTVLGATYIHNILTRTIEDFSALIDGDSIYTIGNPGEGAAKIYPASYPPYTTDFAMPKPKRQFDALELTMSRRFAHNWFASANYTFSRLYGNYTGLSDADEILTPTTGVSSSTAQQQGGSIARPGSNSHSAWDTDTILWDSHGHVGVFGRLPTDRPHVFKLYGSYAFNFGTQIGAFFYGASGTPMSTVVNSGDLEPLLVEGRGDMGRTPILTRTDMLVSHEIKLRESQKVRFEFNFVNLFNQKTPTHIFNFLNKGAPGGSSTVQADAIDMSKVDLRKGYDYNALIRATQDGQAAFDPRYKQSDLWQTGLQGYASVKFIF